MRAENQTPPHHWTRTRLGDVSTITLGGTPSTEVNAFWGGNVPWMSSGDVHQRRIRDVPGRITEAGLASSNATLIEPPAVAVALAGQGRTRGTVALVETRLCANQSVALITGRPGYLHTGFLFHELGNRYEELRARSSGGGRAGLSRRVLAAVPMCLPPIGEQRHIAEVLDTVDVVIRDTERLIAKLRRTADGLLAALLTVGLGEDGQLRDPSEQPAEFTMGLLGLIPRRWVLAPLCELTDPSAPIRYGIVQSGRYVPGGQPVLTIGDLSGDFSSGLHRTAAHIDAMYARSRVRGSDVILSIKGTIGRVAVVPEWFEGNISRDLARLRFTKGMSPRFVFHYLRGALGQRRLQLAVVGTTRAEISIHVLRRLVLPRPDPEEQEAIVDRLDCAEVRIAREEAVLRKLKLLRRGLADDLLSGQARVATPIVEAAS